MGEYKKELTLSASRRTVLGQEFTHRSNDYYPGKPRG